MKKIVETIKELNKTPRGKAVLFFGFYMVFFIFIIIFVRVGSRNSTGSYEYEKGNSSSNYNFDISGIANGNYKFTYTITVDGVDTVYSGEKYEDTELITYNNNNYYRNGDNYFINNTLWIKSGNPYIYSDFLEYDNIANLLVAASYESKTSYDSGKEIYNFLISTNTINQLLNNINSDFSEEPNRITISSDEDKNINEIIYYLDSYCTLNKLCNSSLKIDLMYDDFGNVEEIENPIN
jgi:hypothetical protein